LDGLVFLEKVSDEVGNVLELRVIFFFHLGSQLTNLGGFGTCFRSLTLLDLVDGGRKVLFEPVAVKFLGQLDDLSEKFSMVWRRVVLQNLLVAELEETAVAVEVLPGRLTLETANTLPLTDERISGITTSAMPLAVGRPHVRTSVRLGARQLIQKGPVSELVGSVVSSVPDPLVLLFD